MQIQVGNTAIAEGLHSIRDGLAELQAQIDEDRKQLPLEQIPRSAMLAKLAEKAKVCVEQLKAVQRDATDAVESVYDELNRIGSSLTQLQSLLTSMQARQTDLRSYSFDPITRVVGYLSSSLDSLEKRALAANKTRFWPWALLGTGIIGGAFWALFNLTATSVFLFGDNQSLHELSAVLLASLVVAFSVAGTAWQFYSCYIPESYGVRYSGLPYRFWVWAPVTAFGTVLGVSLMYESWPFVQWLGSYRHEDAGLVGFLSFILMAASIIGAIANVVVHWDDLT